MYLFVLCNLYFFIYPLLYFLVPTYAREVKTAQSKQIRVLATWTVLGHCEYDTLTNIR